MTLCTRKARSLRRFQCLIGFASTLLLVSCDTDPTKRTETPMDHSPEATVLFVDPMTGDWEKSWFLDGQRATLEHRDGGLAFVTNASELDKNVDRAGFDAQHAVLWTRQEFEGDIRITYSYTKLPGCSWQKLIYVQAQGIGKEPYLKDIYAWRDLRLVAKMSEYYNHMNLIGLSIRDQVRCKRYPWNDVTTEAELESEFLPRAEIKPMPIGRQYDVVVEKRKESIMLRIADAETGELVVDHSWTLTAEKVLENRDPKFIEKGRIGIRQMGGHKILMRDFKVERL